MTIGVYQIRNTITDTCYIGASQNTETRWKGHVSDLRSGRHMNSRLQSDWATYGESAFEFTLIECVDSHEALAERERYHMQQQLLIRGDDGMYSKIARAGHSLLPHAPLPVQTESLNFRFSVEDINRLRYIVKHRYPDDRQMMAKTIRELIREEYARLTAKETTGK